MSDALEQLAKQADADDRVAPGPGQDGAAAAAPGATSPAPESSPNIGAIAFLLTMFRVIGGKVLKAESLATTLNDANVQACADVLAPVADKYGINLATAFNGPEVAAIMVAGPILWEAAYQLNLELKAKRAKPVANAEPEGDASGHQAAP